MTAPASVAVIANCQSVGLGQALRLMIPGAAVRIVRVHLTNDETRPRVLENLGRSDLILTQDTRTFGELNAASLKQHFPDKTLVVPNVYYRGFHPDACYVGPLGDRVISPVGDYNSVVVLDSFLKGLTPAQCLERFAIEGEALRLALLAVGRKTQPGQIFPDRGDIFFFGALGIGVVDAQHERAARLARQHPVVQRGADIADMQAARW